MDEVVGSVSTTKKIRVLGVLKKSQRVSGRLNNSQKVSAKVVVTGPRGRQGEAGVDAKDVEFSKTATHIRWRYVGTTEWFDLVPLADIKGDQGIQGVQGIPGINGTNGVNGTNGIDGQNGSDGVDGVDGQDGRPVELRKTVDYVQWRYVGDVSWVNLIPLADIRGEQGLQGIQGVKGDTGEQGLPGANGSNGSDGTRGTLWYTQADYASHNDVIGMLNGDLFLYPSGEVYIYQAGVWVSTFILEAHVDGRNIDMQNNALSNVDWMTVSNIQSVTGGGVPITVGDGFDLGGTYKIIGVQDPTDPQDVATKAYVDSVAGGSNMAMVIAMATVL